MASPRVCSGWLGVMCDAMWFGPSSGGLSCRRDEGGDGGDGWAEVARAARLKKGCRESRGFGGFPMYRPRGRFCSVTELSNNQQIQRVRVISQALGVTQTGLRCIDHRLKTPD